MKLFYKMESVLITISGILCTILLFQLLYKLRSILRWRVNCWFCNKYFWVKFVERNCWTCPECEQYNGFTKDGDYNKPILSANEQVLKTPKVFHSSPPRNGLCKMCNINQQLKVVQLANFVPMNERHFEDEIESYKMQLEKAYKLCSPCKKVLQVKLHKEKETFLGTKLLKARTPEKKNQKYEIHTRHIQSFINSTSMCIAVILLIIVSVECYKNIMKHKNLSKTVIYAKEILSGLLERIISIAKMKMLMTFPSLDVYVDGVNNNLFLDILPTQLNLSGNPDNLIMLTQKALGGFACLIQIIGHIISINIMKHSIIIDLLWTVFLITSIAHSYVTLEPTIMSLVKILSTTAVILIYRSMKSKKTRPTIATPTTPKRMKNLASRTANSMIDDEDMLPVDTDDDVSLCKFGLHNFSDSSNETVNPNNLINGRSFTPRSNESIWTKPKLNSTFCVNSLLSKSPSSVSETVFAKPSFNKYRKLTKDDSDSELDESISSLCISPKKSKSKNSTIFSLRKFTASPNFVAPTPLTRSRPLISPSTLGHSTSWVAGGYWGSEGERQIFNLNNSRSSSQSSGFESQASSMNQRNVFSQPPSREESVFGEPDRNTALRDPFQNCNMSNYGNYQPQNFSRVSSPVFPQMQYNSHVLIPQPRLPQHNAGHNVFAQQQYVQTNMFKAPGGSGLIKLPQVNPFAAR